MIEINNVNIVDSCDKIASRLRAIGINPKNAAIDVTNYICYDMAQPMHCFDADQINGNIIVRMAENGEKFTSTIMPTDDLTLKRNYIEKSLNKTFYYGTMYADQYTRVTEGDETIFEIDNDDLSIVEEPKEAEYIDNKKMTIEYLQPRMSQDKSSEYAKLRGTTEKANWIKNNGFVLYIAAPSDINNIVYEYDTDVYKDLNELSKTIKIDGNEYRQFNIDAPALPQRYDSTFEPAQMVNKVIINYKK